MPESP